MSKHSFSWDRFNEMPLIGIIRHLDAEALMQVLPVFKEAGLLSLEITMNTAGAAGLIHRVRRVYPELNVGAGTVCTADDWAKAKDAGAQFMVTPVTNKKIIKLSVKNKIPVFPGAFTPTEIFNAWSWGASLVKVYPARALGAAYIKDIKAPLNNIRLLPTGGIELQDIKPFRQAGADGFGIGTPLFLPSLIAEKNWPDLLDHFKQFAAAMRAGV